MTDPWGKKLEGAPISVEAREELLRHQSPDQAPQKPQYRGDAISRRLDTITLEDHLMESYGISRETVRTFLSPDEGGGYGLGPDALSGYTAYAFNELGPIPDEGTEMFPDGNSGIARLIAKTLIPESIAGSPAIEDVCRNRVNFAALDRAGAAARIRLDSTAVWVKHDGDPAKSESVTVAYTRGGKTYRVKARSVVMAGGSWTTKHIVRDLPADRKEAYSQFYRSPCMVANVAVSVRFDCSMGKTRWRSDEIRIGDHCLHSRREDVSSESALRGDGRWKLDDEAYCPRPSCGSQRGLLAVLSLALHGGQHSGKELEISLQARHFRVPVV